MNYTQLYIGGKWCDASDGGQFAVINPMDESHLADVASGTVTDALAAMDAADAAFRDWRGRSPRARGEILRKAFELFTARLDDFARLITLENGKARSDAMGEAAYAAEFIRWHSEEAVRSEGHMGIAPASGARTIVDQKPAGIAVLVTPWNYPAAMATRKIAPGPGGGMSRGDQTGVGNAVDYAGVDAAVGGGRSATRFCQCPAITGLGRGC
jgi:succinate-semialdehyde dehydrogenase/glutarate-semialdehyde dehydrogenase